VDPRGVPALRGIKASPAGYWYGGMAFNGLIESRLNNLTAARISCAVEGGANMNDGVLICELCRIGYLPSTNESAGACAQCNAEAADGRRYCKRHGGYTSHDKFLGENKTCEVSNFP